MALGSEDDLRYVALQAAKEAQRSAQLARAALIVACISIAIAILGLFLPIG